MTSGWVPDGNVGDQIQGSIDDAVKKIVSSVKEPEPDEVDENKRCEECDETIPISRQKLVKTNLCVRCQSELEKKNKESFSPYNRRGSMDSQLK